MPCHRPVDAMYSGLLMTMYRTFPTLQCTRASTDITYHSIPCYVATRATVHRTRSVRIIQNWKDFHRHCYVPKVSDSVGTGTVRLFMMSRIHPPLCTSTVVLDSSTGLHLYGLPSMLRGWTEGLPVHLRRYCTVQTEHSVGTEPKAAILR